MTAPDTRVMTMAAPSGERVSVTPRDLHFHSAGAGDRAWLGGDAVGTAVFNALSLTFPEGERLFMDAVRQYRDGLGGALLEETGAFIAQEAIHSREHVAFNGLLDRAHYPVAAVEAEIRQRMAEIRERGSMAMLGVTIALEHFTAMMADLVLEDSDLLAGAPPEIARFWRWHAMEETEHKAVAFDVFLEATRDWTPRQRQKLRNGVMRTVTVLFVRNISHYAVTLLRADGVNRWVAYAQVLWFLFCKPGLFARTGRLYWAWYRADFHPWRHDNRHRLEAWRAPFDAPDEPLHAA